MTSDMKAEERSDYRPLTSDLALRCWLRDPNVDLCSIGMLEAEGARLAGIQFHIRLKLPGAAAGHVLAFDLNYLVTGLQPGGFRERTLDYLRDEKRFDQGIEEKPFAFHADGEPEFLFCRVAGLRESEQKHEGHRDAFGELSGQGHIRTHGSHNQLPRKAMVIALVTDSR